MAAHRGSMSHLFGGQTQLLKYMAAVKTFHWRPSVPLVPARGQRHLPQCRRVPGGDDDPPVVADKRPSNHKKRMLGLRLLDVGTIKINLYNEIKRPKKKQKTEKDKNGATQKV